MNLTLSDAERLAVSESLWTANVPFNARLSGDPTARQPVHTVYGGAQLFTADTAVRLGEIARAVMAENAATAGLFAKAFGIEGTPAYRALLHRRVMEKLDRESVEDYRIDFEDGYGHRPDAEEDRHALQAAAETARAMERGTLPPFFGIRVKPFTEELKSRALRTLDVYLTTLLDATGGALPDNFVVTLPKVTVPEQVAALVQVFTIVERRHRLPAGLLRLEIMVETPQVIVGSDGVCALPALVRAAAGRCVAAHFGVYDYTGALQITSAHQAMDHPACDFARHMMQVALAGTGVFLADGATNVLPIGPHRAAPGERLSDAKRRENRMVVTRAWKLAFDHTTRSLQCGYYQGWDLHPAQLPARYAAVYDFFLRGREAAARRLTAFIDQAARATLSGDVFDDAASGQGLLNFFLRGINCGAITEEEAAATGLTLAEIRSRSFARIVAGRKGSAGKGTLRGTTT